MGLMDTLQNQMDVNRKIELASPIGLDELLVVLEEKVDPSFGKPVIKKGLFGKAILYPKTSRVTVRITAKNNIVSLTKETDTSSASMSVGGMSFNLSKDMRGKNALNTLDAGAEYFKNLADAVSAALAGR